MNSSDLRTDLAQVKGMGSAKSGTHHWWLQRFTAVILVIWLIWAICFIKCCTSNDISTFIACLQKPYNIVPLSILIMTSFYHGMLGMRVIIEDYLSCICIRYTLIILLQIFCIVTSVSFIVAVLYIMNLR